MCCVETHKLPDPLTLAIGMKSGTVAGSDARERQASFQVGGRDVRAV